MRRVLMVVVAAVIITVLIPLKGIEPITAILGQRWEDADVVASYDTPIIKSEALLSEQRANAAQQSKPVFRVDTTTLCKQLRQYKTDVSTANEENREEKYIVSELLSEVYKVGIISQNEFERYANRAILLSNEENNELQNCYIGSLYTPLSAIEYIEKKSSLPAGFITNYITPNLNFDDHLSTLFKSEAVENISKSQGIVHRGDIILFNGQIVDEATLQVINSYNLELNNMLSNSGSVYWIVLFRFILVFIVLMLNYLFFTRFSVHYFGGGRREMLFIMMVYVLFLAMLALMSSFEGVSLIYIVPLSMVGIYLLTFFNLRVAILGNVTIAALGALYATESYDYFMINFVSNMAAIFMMRHYYHRGKLIRALGSVLVLQALLYFVFSLLRHGDLTRIDYMTFIWIGVSGLLFLGFYQLVYVLERMFGFVSDVTLLELCDTNQPLLMQLAQNAPGTFQHSVQVANLAESAAKHIGANPLLARTGALYHDIGKMENPFYFVENLTGVFNPHNDVTPYQSTEIIKKHVTDGVEIAKRHKLPESVIHFIESHHGDSVIYFFYDKARKEAEKEGKEVNKDDFRYNAPKPVSRETSICMMADAVEAASRSLPSYDADPLNELVDRIVGNQIKEGVFNNSELTFQEIAQVKELFKAKLNNIYHGRIAYPVRK